MKYLLCRPLGGINDMLMRIFHCYQYCKFNNRVLLIDTKYNSFFANSFDKYFTFNKTDEITVIYNSDEIYKLISENDFSVYPHCLKNNLLNYTIEYKDNNMYIVGTDILSNIDLKVIYDEDIILYNIFGGGNVPHYVLQNLTFNKNVIDEIIIRYNKITTSYVGIHIRNTDYTTDYRGFYEQHKATLENNPIFLATDSKEVLDFFKSKNIKLYTFVKEFNDNNLPIHDPLNIKNDKDTIIIDLLCDLILLSLADTLIIPETHYGFSRLAHILFDNKHIVHSLLNEPIISSKYKKIENTVNTKFTRPDLTNKKYTWGGGIIIFIGNNTIMTTWGPGNYKWLNTVTLNIEWNSYSHTVTMDSSYNSYVFIRNFDNAIGYGSLVKDN
jgi:hypothetical protein